MADFEHLGLRFSIVIAVLFFLSVSHNISAGNQGKDGRFTIDLIHRDSPQSPLYNPSETPAERLDRFSRRFTRFSTNAAESPVSSDNGMYLMKISIGTPTFDVYGIYDTGSDLMWAQCLPCPSCYKQKNPMFDPSKSSTFKQLSCDSQQCHLLDTVSCSPENLCNFTYGYGDGSLAQGVMATETLTVNSNSIPNIVFGCGHNNSGTFAEDQMGLIGMGGRPLSLASQIMSSLGSGQKFSQCLVPFRTDPSITSKLIFGGEAVVSGGGVVSTPLLTKDDPTYYHVTLTGISVGDKLFPYGSSSSSSNSSAATKGNVFIDSGTPPTLLPRDFYDRLVEGVKEAVSMEPVEDPELKPQLCYGSSVLDNGPILTAHLDGGDVELKPLNTFISPKEGVYCFAMQPIDGDIGILGNFVQMNFLIGFDLDAKIVSFKPADCTKQ